MCCDFTPPSFNCSVVVSFGLCICVRFDGGSDQNLLDGELRSVGGFFVCVCLIK